MSIPTPELTGRVYLRSHRFDIPRFMSVIALALGGVVLVGWALDVASLKSVLPGLVTMKPNTALGFLAAGSALWAIRGSGRACRVSLGFSAVAVAIGGLTLFEYASGVNLGIDDALWAGAPASVGGPFPSRMHPMTALNFVLLNAALALLAVGQGYRVAQSLALAAAAVAASALIGYIYGVRVFVGIAAFNQMALHTAVGMLAVACGALFARPDRGLMAAITGDTAGGLMARRLLPVAIAVPVVLDGLTLIARNAGLFDERFGTAVRVVITIALFLGFIGWDAHSLHRIDLERRKSAGALQAALDDLEERVCERTAELRRSNEELGQEVLTRERVAESLRQGESIIRTFYDSAPAMMGVVDLRGDDIIYASGNAASAAFYGVAPEALAGRSAGDFRVPAIYQRQWLTRYREAEATGRPVRFSFPYRGPTGARHWSASVCHIPGSDSRFTYLVEDVTAQARAESAQAAQHAAARVLAGASTFGETIHGLLREVGECLGLDVGEYWELDEATGRLRPGADSWSRTKTAAGFVDASLRHTFAPGEGLPGRVLSTGRPVRSDDVGLDRTYVRTSEAAAAGLRGAFGFPIVDDTGPVGVVAFMTRRVLADDEPPPQVMETLGRQIGLFVARLRAEEALRRAHDDLEERVRERTAELERANDALQGEVAERRRAEQELRRSEARFRLFTEAMPQLVWTTTAGGDCDYLSRQWIDYTGVSAADHYGTGWLTVLHPDDLGRARSCWEGAVAGRGLYDLEFRIRAADGEYRWFQTRGIAVRDGSGAVAQWLGTCTDIDDRKRAEEALRRAHDDLDRRVRERTAELEWANNALEGEVADRRQAERDAHRARKTAEAATRAKSEFLANMSHEIRTPMNGIIGMTELALDTELTARQREYLGTVISSAEALLTVINDILDFSKIEAGKLDLDPVPFDLRDALDDTMRALALRAHGKGLELACRIAPDVSEALVGDPHRLRQIIVNLTGNAIKFTEAGEVLVGVERAAGGGAGGGEGGGGELLHFSVTDTGIGIAPEKQAAVFVPFEQADGSTTRKYGGTGLGLAIATKLVELMGGRIWLESEPGRGSTFHFTARLTRQSASERRSSARELPRLEGLPLLVVDDNATNVRILHEVLTNWGARPSAAEGGDEALTLLHAATGRAEPFAAALVDVMMPGMDGFDLAEKIRAVPAFESLPLLILTSAGRPDDLTRCRSLRIAACLTKPVRQSELLDALMNALTPAERRQTSGEPAPRPAANPEPPAGAAPRRLRILLAEDHAVNQKVAVRMLEGMGHSVTVAGDGQQALVALDRAAFDLVLMDLQMPVMGGFEALAAVRAHADPARRALPVLALTAHAMKGDRERCLAAGFDGYLSKPIRVAELRAALDPLAEAVEEAKGPAARTPTDAAPGAPDPNLENLMERCGNDAEFARELIDSFLEAAPRSVSAVDRALGAGDAAGAAAEAHGLKGASLTLGADDLAAACRRMEEAGQRGDLAGASAARGPVLEAWARLKASYESYASYAEGRV